MWGGLFFFFLSKWRSRKLGVGFFHRKVKFIWGGLEKKSGRVLEFLWKNVGKGERRVKENKIWKIYRPMSSFCLVM